MIGKNDPAYGANDAGRNGQESKGNYNINEFTDNVNNKKGRTYRHTVPTEIVLNEDEEESFLEYSGKLIDSGTDAETADYIASQEILRKRIINSKRGGRFIKLDGMKIEPSKWVVKNCIQEGDFVMFYGDTATYKSFMSIALAACVATGKDFYGLPVRRKGAVYYIAAEGLHGLHKRFIAWAQENAPIKGTPIYFYDGVVNLLEASDALAAALEKAIKEETELPRLIIVDTWARSLGDDDSDTQAANEGIGRLDGIRKSFGIAILIVHHVGHQNKDRARGASSLRAAVDVEYRMELDRDKNILFTNTKSKETELLPTKAFKARSVKLLDDGGGYILNEDGEIETSAVLDLIEGYTEPVEGIGANQEWVLQALKETENGNIDIKELCQKFKNETNKRKCQFDQAVDGLLAKNSVHLNSGLIFLRKTDEGK